MERKQKECFSAEQAELAARPRVPRVAISLAKEMDLSVDYLWRRSRESRSLALAQPSLLIGKVATSNIVKIFERFETRHLRKELTEKIANTCGNIPEEGELVHLQSSAFNDIWLKLWRGKDDDSPNATFYWDEVLSAEKIHGKNVDDAVAIGEMIEHCVEVNNNRSLKRETLQWYWVDTSDPATLRRWHQEVKFSGQAKPALLSMLIHEVETTKEMSVQM